MIKTSYFLDVRFGSESKGHPLKLVFNFKKGRAMISMQVDLKVKQWDRKMQQVVGHPQKAILNVMLQERQVEVNQLLYKLSTAGELEGLSVTQIKNLVAERLFSTPAAPKCRGVRFLSRFDAFVKTKSPGTARLYCSTRGLLVAWLGEDAAARITFEQMDVAWLREFERHLVEIGQATNTRAI